MNRSLLLVTVGLVVPLLAGCVTNDNVPDPEEPAAPLPHLPAEATTDVNQLWIPNLTALPSYGEATREWLFDFAKTHHNRISFTPRGEDAFLYLVGELEALGYSVVASPHHMEAVPVVVGQQPHYHTVVGTRTGTIEPEKHIGLVAHFDSRYTSNEGAYDDGSGVAAVLALAKHFAEVDTRKTVSIILFDGEEWGLKASCYYANDLARNGSPYDIIFGYDMVGMNWPGHDWKMYQMMGDEDDIDLLLPLVEHVYRNVLQLPEEGVEILTVHDRNSDERRFREIGLPIYRWAGGRHAADYPHYHQPTDTYETMIEFAGGEKNFEMGMDTVLQTSIAMVHAADQWNFPEYKLTEQDCSFYGPDDGPL